jgi:hypothetical protein
MMRGNGEDGPAAAKLPVVRDSSEIQPNSSQFRSSAEPSCDITVYTDGLFESTFYFPFASPYHLLVSI